jgi:hypothetical protein
MGKFNFHTPLRTKEVSASNAIIKRRLKRFSAIAYVMEANVSPERRLPDRQPAIQRMRFTDISARNPLRRAAQVQAEQDDNQRARPTHEFPALKLGGCPRAPVVLGARAPFLSHTASARDSVHPGFSTPVIRSARAAGFSLILLIPQVKLKYTHKYPRHTRLRCVIILESGWGAAIPPRKKDNKGESGDPD